MAKSERDILKLLMKLIGHKTGDISLVDYFPQKPAFEDAAEGEITLPRCTPEEMGVDSAFLLSLFKALYENNSCHIHKVMAVRKGHVIGEYTVAPYNMDIWHVTHSMCKSVTGMAIGLLIYEGKLKLDDRVGDIFSARKNPLQLIFSSNITVRHLLTMSSGVSFNEAGAFSGNDWRKFFLESSQKNVPGTVFEYNSMNSYMLSAIVTEITGESMFDYLKPRLFDHLGIKRTFWETCPQNINKGGWGMFLRTEDMAKLGQLYLNKGIFDGKQILPAEWVTEATKAQIETGKEASPGYGFQLWTNSAREGAYTFNGMLGQNVYVYPDIEMMIVTNAGNDDLFQSGNMSQIVREYMSQINVSDEPIEVTTSVLENQARLVEFRNSLGGVRKTEFKNVHGGWNNRRISMTHGTRRIHKNVRLKKDVTFAANDNTNINRLLMKALDGVTYDMDDKGVGIMPLFMQVMHNNFTDGIKSIGFEYDSRNDNFYLIIKEGELTHRIRCGSRDDYTYYDLDEHGEKYKMTIISEFSTDEYSRPVLKNEIYFVEDSTTRVMNIYFGKKQPLDHRITFDVNNPVAPEFIGIRLDEIPGSNMLFNILDQFGSLDLNKGNLSVNGLVINLLNGYGAMDALSLAIKDTVRPKLHGIIHSNMGKNEELEYDTSSDSSSEQSSEPDGDKLIDDGFISNELNGDGLISDESNVDELISNELNGDELNLKGDDSSEEKLQIIDDEAITEDD